MSFLPALIDVTTLTLIDIAIMGLIICSTIGGTMFFYALTVLKAKNKMSRSSNHKIAQRIGGSLVIATGLWLLARGYF